MLEARQCEELLSIMTEGGAEYADIFIESRDHLALRLEDSKIEHAVQGRESGVGLRAVKGELTRYASTNSFEIETLRKLAAGLAGEPTAVAPAGITIREITRPNPNRVAIDPATISAAEKVAMLQTADQVARAIDERIIQVAASFSETVREVVVATSDGDLARETRTIVTLSVQAMARGIGEIQSGRKVVSGSEGWEFFDRPENQPETLARLAGELAIRNLEADHAPAGFFTVVLSSSAGGTMVHEACGHGLEGDFVRQNMSVYADRLGQTVASPLITVIDDGTLPNKRGTETFDDEGVPTERVVLIERGVLKRYLQSRKSARETGLAPTGNGRRESFRFSPIPRMRNTIIAPGDSDPDAIVRSVERGIFVGEMGGGEVDVVSGNFLFNVTEGFLIEGGKITRPIRGASLIGNGPNVLSKIDMVGTDLGFGVGTCGKEGQGVPVADAQPTLRIPGITVGGIASDSDGSGSE